MFDDVNFDLLEEILEINRAIPAAAFCMDAFGVRTPCGTAHCLIGNYLVKSGRQCRWAGALMVVDSELQKQLSDELGISMFMFRFLFTSHQRDVDWKSNSPAAFNLSRSEALARLEKTIGYLRQRQNLWRRLGRGKIRAWDFLTEGHQGMELEYAIA